MSSLGVRIGCGSLGDTRAVERKCDSMQKGSQESNTQFLLESVNLEAERSQTSQLSDIILEQRRDGM